MRSDALERAALSDVIGRLPGQTIWVVSIDRAIGPALGLGLGGRRLRRVPLTNPHVTVDERLYEPEVDIYVTCSWRLTSRNDVVTSSQDQIENRENDAAALMLDRTVIRAELDPVHLDISLYLNDMQFTLFCDEVSDGGLNYLVTLEDTVLIVGAKSQCRTERRTFPRRPPLRLL